MPVGEARALGETVSFAAPYLAALYEELAHDDDGRLVTGSFMDYAIPLADRVPDIDTLIVEVPAPDGPFGAKGMGEDEAPAAEAEEPEPEASEELEAEPAAV